MNNVRLCWECQILLSVIGKKCQCFRLEAANTRDRICCELVRFFASASSASSASSSDGKNHAASVVVRPVQELPWQDQRTQTKKIGVYTDTDRQETHSLHIIMAKSFFLPRKRGEYQVDHLTNDPGANRIEVLAWASAPKNVQRSYETNENRQSSAPKQSKPVLGRRIRDQEQADEEEEWTTYASTSEAARQLGLNHGNISDVCLKKRKTTGGYEFVFAEQSFVHTPGEIWRKPYEDSEAMVSNLGNFCNANGVYSTPRHDQMGTFASGSTRKII